MKKNKVDVRVKMEPDDILAYQKYVTRDKAYFRYMVPLMAISLACVAIASWNNLLYAAMFFMVAVFMVRNYIRKGGNVPFSEQKELKREAIYSFTEKGLGVETITRESFGEWNKLKYYQETEDTFYIYLSDYRIFIIPKHFFESEDDIMQARTYVSVLPTVTQSSDKLYRRLLMTFISYIAVFVFAIIILVIVFIVKK